VLDQVIWISLEELGQQRELDPRLLKDGGHGDPARQSGSLQLFSVVGRARHFRRAWCEDLQDFSNSFSPAGCPLSFNEL
jgi:hypothetical protein